MTVTVEPGGTFAGYAVETVVGRGGMGIVYRAADVALGRPVALKLIAPEFADDERFRARFLRESRLAASLDHPNVVPIYAAGEAAGQLYIAMRFVDGSDLKTLLSRGSLTPERWLAIVEQVASALDAAHHRGLVHRDVKPGNVLVDEGGHAYLTDFGVTKQVGAASTDTGRIMGTLDYLAPEQIRGDPVDGRADVYALGCVLYECVVGTPPFRRETEPETLWAHMQDEPTPLPEQPALEAVLHKALAKDREERHATCGELVGEAREALGLGTGPAIRGRRIPPGLLRRRRVILAAGLAVLAATVAAVAVALVGGGGTEAPPSDNGVAAIAATGDGIASFAETSTAPGNLAVGEGAVWALNTEDETVSRLDPKTGDVVDSFDTGHQPTDIAAGAGAVWVGNGDGKFRQTARLSRVDPDSTAVTRTVKLPAPPGGEGFSFSAGFPAIAVGAGGVWASTPDETVARIDPKTGRIAANVKIEAKSLAAGKEGVWLVNFDNAVTRIDPRTNRPGQRIEVGSNLLSGVAVGAGSVWATSEEGLLWRIEPGPKPITRTIDVGIGSAYVAFGAGYVWTANWVKGTVSRIDPRTNAVVSTVRVGAPQALAAGEGAAWVSVASGPRGTLPASTCSGIASGGRTPDLLIASDMPLQGTNNAPPRAVVGGIRAVPAGSRSVISRATTRRLRPVASSTVSAPRTPTHTAAPSGSSRSSARGTRSARRSRSRSSTRRRAGRWRWSVPRTHTRTSRGAACWRCRRRSDGGASLARTTRRASATTSGRSRGAISKGLRSPSSRRSCDCGGSTCSTTMPSGVSCSPTASPGRRRGSASRSRGTRGSSMMPRTTTGSSAGSPAPAPTG